MRKPILCLLAIAIALNLPLAACAPAGSPESEIATRVAEGVNATLTASALTPAPESTPLPAETPTPIPACIITPRKVYEEIYYGDDWSGAVDYFNGDLRLGIDRIGISLCVLVLEVTVENKSNQVRNVNPLYFHAIDSAAQVHELAREQYSEQDALDAIDVYPGTYTKGMMYFDFCKKETSIHIRHPAFVIYDDAFTPPIIVDLGEVVGCF